MERVKVRATNDSRNIQLIRNKTGCILDCVQVSDDEDDVKYIVHFGGFINLTLELDYDQFEIC